MAARIFSIVDTFDAITSERPYRLAQSVELALSEIENAAGKQLDAALVDVFLKMRLTGYLKWSPEPGELVDQRLKVDGKRGKKVVETEAFGGVQCADAATG